MIKYIIILVTAFSAVSCGFLAIPITIFRYENISEKDVKISFFSERKLIDKISIPNGKKHEYSFKGKPHVGEDQSPFIFDSIDSVVLEFNDGKKLIKYCDGNTIFPVETPCNIPKNFVDFAGGNLKRKRFSGDFVMTFQITKDDWLLSN